MFAENQKLAHEILVLKAEIERATTIAQGAGSITNPKVCTPRKGKK